MRSNNADAVSAYIAKQQAIVAKLELLLEAADDHFGSDPEKITWADVKNIAWIERILNSIEI